MRKRMETEERDATSRASFKCPSCCKTFTDLEVMHFTKLVQFLLNVADILWSIAVSLLCVGKIGWWSGFWSSEMWCLHLLCVQGLKKNAKCRTDLQIHRCIAVVGEGYKRKASVVRGGVHGAWCVGEGQAPQRTVHVQWRGWTPTNDWHGEQMIIHLKDPPHLAHRSFIEFTNWLHLCPMFGTLHEWLNTWRWRH